MKRCFGATGVELAAAIVDEGDDVAILRLMWISGQGQLAVLLDNWSIELFKIVRSKNGEMALVNYAKYSPEVRALQISNFVSFNFVDMFHSNLKDNRA